MPENVSLPGPSGSLPGSTGQSSGGGFSLFGGSIPSGSSNQINEGGGGSGFGGNLQAGPHTSGGSGPVIPPIPRAQLVPQTISQPGAAPQGASWRNWIIYILIALVVLWLWWLLQSN